MRRRYVFLLSGSGRDVVDGSTIEVRAETDEEATTKAGEMVGHWGAETKLIGLREGMRSTAVFIPLVAIVELPEHVIQNEVLLARKVA